jgi:hypothetical protein
MILRIRRWLRMPLFTKRELRNLNGFWFCATTKNFVRVYKGDTESIELSLGIMDALDEFLDAIEWIEEMKA